MHALSEVDFGQESQVSGNAVQAMGIALVSLKGAEYMEQPRKVCQVSLPMYKPEAHGQLLKLAKVTPSMTRGHAC